MRNRLRPNPSDRWTARFVLIMLVAYLAWTLFIAFTRNFEAPITPLLAIMLIPVFLVDGIKTFIESFTPKKVITGDEDLSKVTVVIPTYNGGKHIGVTLTDLVKRFPKDQIIVSSNGSRDDTCDVVRTYGVRLLEIEQPIGKVEAINRALHMVKTPYTLIMDDDTLVGDAVIPTTVLDEGHGGVAFRVYPVRKGPWSLIQLHEYRKSMDVGRRYHNHSSTVQNISGAVGLYRTQELIRQADIHTGEFSGEDLQRTLLVHLSRNTGGGVVMSESIIETMAPDSFMSLFNQRVYGWYPGFLANFHLYWRLLFMRNIPKRLRFEAFFNCFVLTFLDPIRLLSLPILLFTPTYLVFFYIVYVLLETIPWFSTGRNEPYWVILVFPLYGIFNFLTRMLSMSVFFYRRITKIIGKGIKNDDYKFMRPHARLIGVLTSSIVTLSFAFVYGSFLTAVSNYEAILYIPRKIEQSIAAVAESIRVDAAKDEYTITVKSGDSRWTISKFFVQEYMKDKNLLLSSSEVEVATYWLVINSGETRDMFPGETIVVKAIDIEIAVERARI